MEKKYFLGMLLSGAMLAACTADDDLNTSPVAQVNPSAPVFTVHYDNNGTLQNRAIYENDKVTFQGSDKLSLFHGAADKEQLKNWQNAIYKGSADDDGTFTFSTESMVNPKFAIMVYPADTEFNNPVNGNLGPDAPIVRIPKSQNAKTKENTPYMSEVLEISDYERNPWNKNGNLSYAGYGEQYDIVLRRIGTTLYLTLTPKNSPTLPAGVDALTVSGVALKEKTSTTEPFTTGVRVKGMNQRPAAYVYNTSNNTYKHLTWWRSDLDLTNLETANEISTSDVVNNKATFTLLPTTAAGGGFTDGQVVVYTTYGTVTLSGTSDNDGKIWKKGSTSTYITKGLNELNSNAALWAPATQGTFFKATGSPDNENVGAYLNRTVEVDLSKLDMNNLHIKDAKHLRNAIKVYDALHGNDEDPQGRLLTTTFILDGDAEGNFEMDAETWNAVLARLAKNNNKTKLEFAPCDERNPCYTVVLNNNDEGAEVPALQFVKSINDNNTVDLALKGAGWTYESKTAGNSAKDIQGVNEIHVLNGSDLTPKSYIAVKSSTTPTLVVDAGGTMNVKSNVDAQIPVRNEGTIEITTSGMLRVGNGKVLENWATHQRQSWEWWLSADWTGLTRTCGTINNAGTLGVVVGQGASDGIINNYGIINIKNEDAATAITTNATDPYSFANKYSDGNKIGTINLANATGSKKTEVKSDLKGFIVYTIDKETPTYADFGGDDCYANYIILGSKVKNIKFAANDKNVAQNLPGKYDATSKTWTYPIQYIEVNGKVNFDGTFDLEGLIVKSGNVDILNTAVLNVGSFYLKGTVGVFGKLNQNATTDYNVDNYYGKTDKKNFTGPGAPAN